jgi:hypothetical protein
MVVFDVMKVGDVVGNEPEFRAPVHKFVSAGLQEILKLGRGGAREEEEDQPEQGSEPGGTCSLINLIKIIKSIRISAPKVLSGLAFHLFLLA